MELETNVNALRRLQLMAAGIAGRPRGRSHAGVDRHRLAGREFTDSSRNRAADEAQLQDIGLPFPTSTGRPSAWLLPGGSTMPDRATNDDRT
jgi:hypothetical protein